jgi:hypothetical protein
MGVNFFLQPRMNCDGNGHCLEQVDENEYKIDENCPFKCRPVPCPNVILCGNLNPQCQLNCHGGRCVNCDILFGDNLTFVDAVDCPVCFETKQGMEYPVCKHHICVDCFRRLSYGPPKPADPPFPFPELEDAYDDDPYWIDTQPDEVRVVVKAWNVVCNDLDNAHQAACASEKHLHRCPICRHEHVPPWRSVQPPRA